MCFLRLPRVYDVKKEMQNCHHRGNTASQQQIFLKEFFHLMCSYYQICSLNILIVASKISKSIYLAILKYFFKRPTFE